MQLTRTGQPGLAGMPLVVPRQAPCVMCEPLWCVKACPTGALDPALTDVTQTRIGLALIDAEHCLSWQGLRCEICFRVCPVQGKAITLNVQQRQASKHAMFVPVVHSDACTGCGLCERSCPTEVAAIRIVDPRLVQGKIGEHYRLGWKDQEAAPAAAGSAAAPAPARPSAPPARTSAATLDYLNRGKP